ncbi:lysozyme inhibitor LprI family protein [Sphingomonas sp. PB4P5]|uniref:lysozyme inhibitor LprI family protein n=1 Tax=Parasphingomonas puruogangriensis TaxID=3096155 RepID=UPI002FC9A6C9
MLLIALMIAAAPVQTQAAMNRTSSASYGQADAAMTAQWKRTYAYMKGRDAQDRSRGGGFGYAAALLASQRAWLKFRDTQCVMAGGEFAGGSAQGMAMATCKTRLTRERTAQLKALVWPS